IHTVLRDARKEKEQIALRHRMTPLPGRTTILGFEEEHKDGRPLTPNSSPPEERKAGVRGRPKDYTIEYLGVAETTLSVRRPHAYLFPPSWTKVVEILQRHGLNVEELREDVDLDLEVYKISNVRETAVFQKRHLYEVEATSRKEKRRIAAGTILVRTSQT